MVATPVKNLVSLLDPYLVRIPALSLARWPRLLMLSTTDHCNLRCAWCPNRFLSRPKARLDLDFSLDLIAQYARGGGGMVQFSAFGEPLLDPHLFARIRAAKRPEITRRICFSNVQLLNESNRLPLVESGLTYLNVSLNEFTSERYEAVMGLPFERAFANLLALIDLNKRRGLPLEINVDIKSALSRAELYASAAYGDLKKRGVAVAFRSMSESELTWVASAIRLTTRPWASTTAATAFIRPGHLPGSLRLYLVCFGGRDVGRGGVVLPRYGASADSGGSQAAVHRRGLARQDG